MTTLVAEACKSLVRKNLKKKERMERRKEGLKRFIPSVKNLKNFDNRNKLSLSLSLERERFGERG